MDVSKIVCELLKTKGINSFDQNITFKELGIDSLDAMDLIIKLEEKLDIKFSDNDLLKIKSIKDLIDLVEKIKH